MRGAVGAACGFSSRDDRTLTARAHARTLGGPINSRKPLVTIPAKRSIEWIIEARK